jgi:hypothetical protein
MIRQFYAALSQSTLHGSATLGLADPSLPNVLTQDSPAIEAMTDLRKIHPISITGDATLEQARTTMIVCGVKLLFVKGARGELSGLITATDLAGEKSIKTATVSARRVPELTVDDLMTKACDLEFLDYGKVVKAELGHIISTLKSRGRQHALVTTSKEGGDFTVIGLYSSTQIARQMGIAVVDPLKAYTFSQIEAAIAQA